MTIVEVPTAPRRSEARTARTERLRLLLRSPSVLIGTLVGERMLLGLSPRRFGQTIGAAIGVLGIWLLVMPV